MGEKFFSLLHRYGYTNIGAPRESGEILEEAPHILQLVPSVVAQMVELNLDDAEALQRWCGLTIVGRLEMFRCSAFDRAATTLSTMVDAIDAILQGGIRIGFVTELVGPPCSGKSVLCRRIALCCATRGLAAVVVSTGSCLLWKNVFGDTESSGVRVVAFEYDFADLFRFLRELELHILTEEQRTGASRKTRCLVIDSFATIVRRSFSGHPNENVERHAAVAKVLMTLKQLAADLELAVIITNESLSDARLESGYYGEPPTPSDESRKRRNRDSARLGFTLHHAVHVRISLEPPNGIWGAGNVMIAKAPYCAVNSVKVRIV